GYTADELIGQSAKLLVPEPDRSQFDACLAVALEAGEESSESGRESLGCRKDGSIFAMDLAVSHFRFGGRQYFTGIIRDISDRRRLELEQQEANERLSSVVDHVADGIITFDEEGLIGSFNRAAQSIFGYSTAEIAGRNVSELISQVGASPELDG